MKPIIIITIIIWAVILIGALGILIFGINGGGENIMEFFDNLGIRISSWSTRLDGTIPADGKASVAAAGVSSLDVDWVAGEILVESYSGSEIYFEQTSRYEIPEDRKLVYLVENGTLRIREGAGLRIHSRHSTSLTLRIPEGLVFTSIDVSGVSSNTHISSLSTSDFTLETVSGNINASDILANGTIKCDTVSGDVKLINLSGAEYLQLKTISGKITAQDITAAELKTDSVSGNVIVDGNIGKVTSKTVSGNTAVATLSSLSEVKMDTVSGDLTLALSENDGFTVSYSKVSGNFSCDFACALSKNSAVYGNGSTAISMKTVSGDLTVKKLG